MRPYISTLLSLLLISTLALLAQARPVIDTNSAIKFNVKRSPQPTPTPAPRVLSLNPRWTPDEIYEFYSPRHLERDNATQVKRQDQPPVPLSSLGPPSFPPSIPSCPICQSHYSSLSSCMGAAAVFANATDIFNNALGYLNVIKCACTDTFQSVYPQCVDCFQNTDQCYYLGTDAKGTGAPSIVTNIRNICGLGSALLGGVASANGNVGTVVPSQPGSYTDVSTTGPGYKDASTGAIFQSNANGRGGVEEAMRGWRLALGMVMVTGLAIMGGAARLAC